ncbi:MAG: hypothetical protein ACFFC6_05505 [Promethearchaeota archaeon]
MIHYWDWTRPERNNDCFVDTRYEIKTYIFDPYPLTWLNLPKSHALSSPKIRYTSSQTYVQGTMTIHWIEAIDFFEHPITYSLLISASDEDWKLIETDIAISSYDWDSTSVVDGITYKIKLVATCSDGATSSTISYATYTVENGITSSSTTINGVLLLPSIIALIFL